MIRSNKIRLATVFGLSLVTSAFASSAFASCQYVVTNSWGSGFNAAIRVTNDTAATVKGWQVNWSYSKNTLSNSWGGQVAGAYTATNLDWNGTLAPKQTAEIGLQGVTNGGAIETPLVTGSLCASVAASSVASSSAKSSSIASSSFKSSSVASSSLKSSSVQSSSVPSSSSKSSASSVPVSSVKSSSSIASSSKASSSAVNSSAASSAPAMACDAHTFPKYQPDLNYDFRTDFGQVDTSKFKVYQGCPASQIAGVKTKGRFAFIWGKNRNPAITDADIDRVLTNLNEDADYIHNTMGWPVDKLQSEGYFANIYLYGSGLCTDSAPNTEKGGWQSGINGYPMVLLSYYPVVTPSERGGITHEFIHTIMATRGNKAAWFNEGGNTWLQMNLEASRTGNYGVGFLDGAPFLAPHVPIENYSGWLQDGTFGGPNAEGVDRQLNGQQISTWRDYLGGNQYNSVFSHFLAEHVSKGANAWIWAKGSNNLILRSLAGGLGEAQTQNLIMEYRARQAMVDFGPWNNAFKVPINDNWGRTVGAEKVPGGVLKEPTPHRLTFYAATTQQGDLLTPSTDTLPGWSGANQIPLKVTGNKVRVNFQPIGRNMRVQLAYRAADGSAVYSKQVDSGEACLTLAKAPKNGVVVAVVSNVDYLYNGEETRTAKFDYRLQLLEGVTGTAPLYDKHYQ